MSYLSFYLIYKVSITIVCVCFFFLLFLRHLLSLYLDILETYNAAPPASKDYIRKDGVLVAIASLAKVRHVFDFLSTEGKREGESWRNKSTLVR